MTYTAVVPYADVTYASLYFADRLKTDPWDGASTVDQNKALKQATRMIDRLSFAGDQHDPAQVNQFPRGNDTTIPDDVAQACCEIAIKLLDDWDEDFEVEANAMVRFGMGEARAERNAALAQEHIMAGIPSIHAWNLLKPYLRDPGHAIVRRGEQDELPVIP